MSRIRKAPDDDEPYLWYFAQTNPEMPGKRKVPDATADEASDNRDPEWNDKWKGTAFASVMNVVHKCELEYSKDVILSNLPADTEALLHATINRADSLHAKRTRRRNIREGPETGDEFLLAKEDWTIVEKMAQVIDEARQLDAKYGRLQARFVKATREAQRKIADSSGIWKAIRRRGLGEDGDDREIIDEIERALV